MPACNVLKKAGINALQSVCMKNFTAGLLLLFALVFAACSKSPDTPSATHLNGTWKYIGFSGGLAGFPFTKDTQSVYLQFDSTHYITSTKDGLECGFYTYATDSTGNGTLTIITSAPETRSSFWVHFAHDTLGLYPAGIVDGMSAYYVPSNKHFECSGSNAH